MGTFDAFCCGDDDEYQTKATGQTYASFRSGDPVRLHPWNPQTEDAPSAGPLDVSDFAVAALAENGWYWVIVRDGHFTGLVTRELNYPHGLPLFGFTGLPHTAGVPLDSRKWGRNRDLN